MHINRFLTHIDGMARQNRFEVDIRVPAIDLRMRALRCQKASLPGKTLELSSFNKIQGSDFQSNKEMINELLKMNLNMIQLFLCQY